MYVIPAVEGGIFLSTVLMFDFLRFLAWRPSQTGSVYSQYWFAVLRTLDMLFHQLWCDANHVLSFPILDHVERL